VDLRTFIERRDLNNGFGETSAKAFEVVITPLVFGIFGWWLDGRTHTRPLFALTLGILVLLYTLWKLSKGYIGRMNTETARVLKRDVTNG
jgi:hypothetical protein